MGVPVIKNWRRVYSSVKFVGRRVSQHSWCSGGDVSGLYSLRRRRRGAGVVFETRSILRLF